MQALYENCDGSFSVGTIVGRGEALRYDHVYMPPRLSPTIQVRFEDTDASTQGRERVESVFADDKYLTVGVLFGSMVSALSKHSF